MKHFADANFRGLLCSVWGRLAHLQWKQAHKDTSFILSDNTQFTERLHVRVWAVLKECRLLPCFHLGCRDVALPSFKNKQINKTGLQPTEVDALSADRTKQRGLSGLKAFSQCKTNLWSYSRVNDHFCSNNKARDDVVNWFPLGQRAALHLGSAGWCKLNAGFSVRNYYCLALKV